MHGDGAGLRVQPLAAADGADLVVFPRLRLPFGSKSFTVFLAGGIAVPPLPADPGVSYPLCWHSPRPYDKKFLMAIPYMIVKNM